MAKYMNSMTCPIFKKLVSSGVNPYSADNMCRQAHKYKIPSTFSAKEIVAALNLRHAYNSPGGPSSEQGNTGVKDNTYPQSAFGDDYESCLASLKSLGISDDRAIEECSTQWKGEGNRGGGLAWSTPETIIIKKEVAARLVRQYPTLSKGAIKNIVNNAVEHTIHKEASKIRSASVSRQVPGWACDLFGPISNLPDATSSTNLRGAALDKEAEYMRHIHTGLTEQNNERMDEYNKPKDTKLRSAKVKDERPSWLRALDW